MRVQPVNIGEKLRALRLCSKKSLQKLAKQLKAFGMPITRETIASWETGQTDVPAQFVPVLARSLNVQMTDLLSDLPRRRPDELISESNALLARRNQFQNKLDFRKRDVRSIRPPKIGIGTATIAYLAENERSPLDAMVLKETRAMLLSIIRRLEHPHQQVLILHYFRGLTAPQIAAKLNLPVSNIAARICGARQKLHRLLCCNSAWRSLRREFRDQFPPLERIIPHQ